MTRLLLTLLALTACSPVPGGGETPRTQTPRSVLVGTLTPAGTNLVTVASPAPSRASRSRATAATTARVTSTPSALRTRSAHVSPTPSAVGKRAAASGWHNVADVIADCESGKRLANGRALTGSYDVRGNDPHSSASGKYSFIDSTWEWVTGLPAPASRYSEAVQDAAFRKLWNNGRGASHWAPSRSCWGWAR